jgi:hypothetical protein
MVLGKRHQPLFIQFSYQASAETDSGTGWMLRLQSRVLVLIRLSYISGTGSNTLRPISKMAAVVLITTHQNEAARHL